MGALAKGAVALVNLAIQGGATAYAVTNNDYKVAIAGYIIAQTISGIATEVNERKIIKDYDAKLSDKDDEIEGLDDKCREYFRKITMIALPTNTKEIPQKQEGEILSAISQIVTENINSDMSFKKKPKTQKT